MSVPTLDLTLDEMQVLHAHRVLAHLGGDKAKAADVLGISRATLYRLLAKAPDGRPRPATPSQD